MEKIIIIGGANTMKKSQKILIIGYCVICGIIAILAPFIVKYKLIPIISDSYYMNLILFTSGMVVCAILDRSYLKNSSSAQKLIGAIIVSSIVILSMIFVIKA